ncbi:hypothetical protein QJS10_CPB13g01086 [Acorus calamus]|uniref:Uncharacterized protein n=1 Tax=Acorus calamus TaxID=4465 RepID=A0AAV9DJN2_ACOCL|nr:hypothetical protein QJS10_CPB13g01086 [Acorus calamus]
MLLKDIIDTIRSRVMRSWLNCDPTAETEHISTHFGIYFLAHKYMAITFSWCPPPPGWVKCILMVLLPRIEQDMVHWFGTRLETLLLVKQRKSLWRVSIIWNSWVSNRGSVYASNVTSTR